VTNLNWAYKGCVIIIMAEDVMHALTFVVRLHNWKNMIEDEGLVKVGWNTHAQEL
jgi:hypothetical protein